MMDIGTFYRPPNSKMDTLEQFCESLDKLKQKHPNRNIIISGDMNLPGIDWQSGSVSPGSSNPALCEKLLEVTLDLHLEQMVLEPTRGENILDVFLTNTPGLVNRCRVGPGISDHDMIITDTLLQAIPNKKPPREINCYKKADWEGINEDLQSFEHSFFSSNPSNRTVEENWCSFKTTIEDAAKKHIPRKTLKHSSDVPWFTRELKQHLRRRDRAFKKSRRSGKTRDKER